MPITIVDAEPSTGQPEFAPRRTAARARKCCVRCGQPVPAGAVIERIPHPTAKGFTWVHADCGEDTPAVTSGADEEARSLVLHLRSELESLRARLTQIEAATPRRVEIVIGDREPIEVEGLAHPALEEVAELVEAGEPVFLPGPSGCGKSHLAQQVAEALGYRFASISCTAGMSESHLLGRSLPTGEAGQFTYCGTPFLDSYEHGGLFLFDEIDAADPNVLLVINSALANGFLNVPARHEQPTATRHPEFRCIAAANTFGKGADRQYCGRNPIDEATLDRFRIGTVPVTYEKALESQLWDAHAAAGCESILETLWRYRDAIALNRLERNVSTRFLIAAAKATARGKDLAYVESKLFAGWREDEVRKVKG